MNGKRPAIVIRPMTAADLDRVREIATHVAEAPHWPRAAYEAAIDPDAAVRRIALVAVEPAGDCASGFAIASLLPPQAELEVIALAGECRRRGFGSGLFHALVEQARLCGAREIALEVRASNHCALAFYGSLGFAQTGCRPSYYADPIEDAVQMMLAIG
jgi:[ribosomal protein S18]-alanine N-acetyltransferase